MDWIKRNKGYLAFGLWFLAIIIQVLADKIYSKDLEPLGTLTFVVAAAVWTIESFETPPDNAPWKKYGVIIITALVVLITAYIYLG
jgi:hypothetical protein